MKKRNKKVKVSCPELIRLALNYAYNVKRGLDDEKKVREFGWTLKYDIERVIEAVEKLAEYCVEGGVFELKMARAAEEIAEELEEALRW